MTLGGGSFEFRQTLGGPGNWANYRRLYIRWPSLTFKRGEFVYANRQKDDEEYWQAIVEARPVYPTRTTA